MLRAESGQCRLVASTFSTSTFSIGSLLEHLAKLIAPLAERKGVSFVLAGTEPRSLYADERAVKQVLLNVISNAVKFTNAGGRVMVGMSTTSQGDLAVTVTDTGIRLP